MAWWEEIYLTSPSPGSAEHFFVEAARSVEDVFAGVTLQRLRLKQDQQGPEWDP